MSAIYDRLAKDIRKKGLTFFCGAGISFDSGFPLANQLVEKLFKEAGLTDEESTPIFKAKLSFESIAAVVADQSHSLDFLSIYEKGRPNFNHYLIAELAKQGTVKIIVTTNFDTLIEQALAERGVAKKQIKVYADEQQFSKIDWIHDPIILIKIHGTIQQKRKMAVTLKTVANAQLSKGRKAVIDHLAAASQPILFLGYSFSDKFDISIHLRLAPHKNADIYTVAHRHALKLPRQANALRKSIYPFEGFTQATEININTGVFMQEIGKHLLGYDLKVPVYARYNWEAPVQKWFLNQTGKYLVMADAIVARLLYLTAQFPIAEKRSQAALAKATTDADRADQLRNLGVAWKELGDYDKALQYLTDAKALAEKLPDRKLLASIYNNISYTYGSKKDYPNAEQYGNDSLKLARKIKDKELLAIIHNNLGILYGATKQYKKALASFDKALKLIDEVGLIQWKPRTINNVGLATRLTGHPSKAIKIHEEVLTLAGSLGFKDEEMLAHENLGRAYLAAGDLDTAISETTTATRLFKKSGKQDSYGKCLRLLADIYQKSGNAIKAKYYRKKAASLKS